MTKIKRLEMIEDKLRPNDELIKEITINFINPDGTTGGTMVSKQVNGVWTKYEKT